MTETYTPESAKSIFRLLMKHKPFDEQITLCSEKIAKLQSNDLSGMLPGIPTNKDGIRIQIEGLQELQEELRFKKIKKEIKDQCSGIQDLNERIHIYLKYRTKIQEDGIADTDNLPSDASNEELKKALFELEKEVIEQLEKQRKKA